MSAPDIVRYYCHAERKHIHFLWDREGKLADGLIDG